MGSQYKQYNLIITPVNPYGNYMASLDGKIIVASTREPLLAGARALLKQGADPNSVVTTRHAGSDHWAMRSTIGAAAALTVVERNSGGIRFGKWQEFAFTRRRAPPAYERAKTLGRFRTA